MWPYWTVAALAVCFVLAYFWRRGLSVPRGARLQRVIAQLGAHGDALAAEFLQAASATGKPRGLRWKSCELTGPPLFAADTKSQHIYALIAVTISFEAIEGGAMEDVEAVGNLRSATAVFTHRGGAWTTDGRVIFNLEPEEALKRFSAALTPLDVRREGWGSG